jgi:hypothetical protein
VASENDFQVVDAKSFRQESREQFRTAYLGDWPGRTAELLKLAETCCAEYDRRCDLSYPTPPFVTRTPGRPSINTIRVEEIDMKYDQALSLGFEGPMHKWRHFVYEARRKERGRR